MSATPGAANRYRLLLAALTVSVPLSWAALRALSRDFGFRDTHGMLDLDEHAIARHDPADGPAIVLLGSSETLGLEIPLNARLRIAQARGRAYNLSSAGGNILTMMAYFKLALAHQPERAIVVVPPDCFSANPADSRIVLARPELLSGMIPAALYAKVLASSRWSYRLRAFLASPRVVFRTAFERQIRWNFWQAREAFYGDAPWQKPVDPTDPGPPSVEPLPLTANEMMSLVGALWSFARAGGVKTSLVIPPLAPPSSGDPTGPEFRENDLMLRAYLHANGIPFNDYEDLFRGHPEFFFDGRHLGAAGVKVWADRVYDDLFASEASSR